MGNAWLKFKIWTKGIIAALIAIYALLFVYNNSADATVWWWFNRTFKSTTVVLIIIAFLAGVISTILVRTTVRTLRQMRDLRSRSRTDRMERELADMKEKASRLQTKPAQQAQGFDVIPPPANDSVE
jgi:uncharacterized integral membrane protein